MPAPPGLRVVLADDHARLRETLATDLRAAGLEVCAAVPDARGAVAAALEHRPDAVLLDVDMPGNGLVAARELRERLPGVAAVMLTVADDPETVAEALAAGARGYVLKDGTIGELVDAVAAAVRGEIVLPRRGR